MKLKKYQSGTDTVNAKLTPKEAVLNRNAAELLGRDAIKRLNAHGNMLAKRGVDLASDPAPYPPTQNLEGYQMGSSDVEHEDQGESMMRAGYRFTPQDLAEMHRQRLAQGQVRRAHVMNEKPVFQFQSGTSDVKDLLADAENTIYGGGHAPAPTPTPTPKPRMNRYQYGTSSVDDFGSPFLKRNATSRLNRRSGIINIQDDPTKPGYNPISNSQYIKRGGSLLGPQYNQNTGRANPFPSGTVGVQGFAPQSSQSFGSPQSLTHTQMAADIARRNLTATGSLLGTPQTQLPPGVQPYVSPEQAASQGLQWGGRSWLPYVSPQQMTDQNLMYTGGPQNLTATPDQTTHFLPPGFTTTVGSTGAQNSSANDINFLPPGFTAVQGNVGAQGQLQFQPPQDQGYGSAYGY